MTIHLSSSGFVQVLQSLGIAPEDASAQVSLPAGQTEGLLSPADAGSLAPAFSATLTTTDELQALSGIPPSSPPVGFPVTLSVFAIDTLIIRAGQVLTIQGNPGQPVVLVVNTLVLERSGLLRCAASLILNVQTFTQEIPQ